MEGTGDSSDRPGGAVGAPRRGLFAGLFAGHEVVDTLAGQAWAQADAGLARAWRESLVLERAIEDARAAADQEEGPGGLEKRLGKLRRQLETIESVAFLLRQELEGVARQRGLELIGDIGEALPYDPERHNIGGLAPAEGEDVRVLAPGVMAEGRSESPLTLAEVTRISRREAKAMAERDEFDNAQDGQDV